MKRVTLMLAAAGLLVLTAGPTPAREHNADDDRYTVVWKEVPAGRGLTNHLPFRVLKEEYRQPAYALTGRQARREVVELREVPAGRGATTTLPFVVRK